MDPEKAARLCISGKARKQAASRDFASARALGRGKVQLEEEDPFQAA